MHVIPNSDEFRLNFAQKKFYAHTDFKILEETLLMSLSELVLNKFPVTVVIFLLSCNSEESEQAPSACSLHESLQH